MHKYCKNCDNAMDLNDRYCTECGARYGEGHYTPSLESMECIYGPPPVKRIHKCKSCCYSWSTFSMIDRVSYCPLCGKEAYTIADESDCNDW